MTIRVRIDSNNFPVSVEIEEVTSSVFSDWFSYNSGLLYEHLTEKGAVYFPSTGIDSLEKFNAFVESLGGLGEPFLGGNAFRSKYTERVYNASEFEPSEKIRLHSEFSHLRKWPQKLFFNCVEPAANGGETIIADIRKVMARLSTRLKDEFATKGLTYIRNLHGGQGLGPSWQQAFETTDRLSVERYCSEQHIKYTWKEDGGIKLKHGMPALIEHPVTQQRFWFNQVEHFHPSIYGDEVYDTLMLLHNRDENELPMYVTFGDGTPIPESFVEEIHNALQAEEVKILWKKSGLLLIDNILSLHGRLAFEGTRKVLVSML
jgi:hypothetical protein